MCTYTVAHSTLFQLISLSYRQTYKHSAESRSVCVIVNCASVHQLTLVCVHHVCLQLPFAGKLNPNCGRLDRVTKKPFYDSSDDPDLCNDLSTVAVQVQSSREV
jgi:hypothetical protein